MPRMDGTGPLWSNQKISSGLGYCRNRYPHYTDKTRNIVRMGRGNCSMGFGSRRHIKHFEITSEEHKDLLNLQKAALEDELSIIKEQLSML